jgi:pectinesterase
MIVATDCSGDFPTLQAAIDAAPAQSATPFVIKIGNGIYREKIKITKPNIHLKGEDPEKTILTFDDHAKKRLPDGAAMNTFNSYSIYIGAPGFRAERITFENSAGDGRIAGQALAAYLDADRIAFRHCRFLGHQDTVFNGPLPKNPTPLGINLVHPVLGLEETEYAGIIRHYLEDCFVRGDIDFIFGSATVVFNRCEIFSNSRGEAVNGYITAASTSPAYSFGYVFVDCRLSGDAGPHSVYLGRPWRDHAHVAFINCWMGEHIIPAGWHNWDKPHREQTVKYLEFGSTGPGASDQSRVSWSKILTPDDAKAYSVQNVLAGPDGWRPWR